MADMTPGTTKSMSEEFLLTTKPSGTRDTTPGRFSPSKKLSSSPATPKSSLPPSFAPISKKRQACSSTTYDHPLLSTLSDDSDDDDLLILLNPNCPEHLPTRLTSAPPSSITIRPRPRRRQRTESQPNNLFSKQNGPKCSSLEQTPANSLYPENTATRTIIREDCDSPPRFLPSGKIQDASTVNDLLQEINAQLSSADSPKTTDNDDLILVPPQALIDPGLLSPSINYQPAVLRPRSLSTVTPSTPILSSCVFSTPKSD